MTLQFVACRGAKDRVVVDTKTRRMVRSHVMKGRNAGRTLARSHRSRAVAAAMSPDKLEHMRPEDGPLMLSRWVGDDIAAYANGVTWTPYQKMRIHQCFSIIADALYPHELCHSTDLYKTRWFQNLFVDEAFFHASLAITTTCLQFYLNRDEESSAALGHLSRAVQIVNKRLSSSDATSENTLSLVFLLAMNEMLRGDHARSKVHLDGLQCLVELRGGLSSFKGPDAERVMHKICRADVEFALLTSSAPRFFFSDIPSHLIPPTTEGMDDRYLHLPQVFSETSDSMSQLAIDVIKTTQLFNNFFHAPMVSWDDYTNIILSLIYQCIRIEQNEAYALDDVQRGWFYGFLAFSVSFLFHFGRRRMLCYPTLSSNIRRLVKKLSGDSSCPDILLLWLPLISGSSICKEESDYQWIFPTMANASRAMGLKSWEDVIEELQGVPWVHLLHGEAGKRMWELCQNYY
nr:transcription factor StrL [Stachybotrys sp.]